MGTKQDLVSRIITNNLVDDHAKQHSSQHHSQRHNTTFSNTYELVSFRPIHQFFIIACAVQKYQGLLKVEVRCLVRKANRLKFRSV